MRNKPMTTKEMSDWNEKTWNKCQEAAWAEPNALRLAESLSRLKFDVKGAENAVAMEQAAAELRRLHQICHDIYEIWAGSEGIPVPQTAPEAYLLVLIEQMRDKAKEGLK